ncbi:hypothetical protein A6A06_38575 [Streptomyces sp. CB02923]|uniref:DUF4231 domain-containing protein n=1 Tax=Streptomyces sp. CB02923 TaxID=1718985 RepID=UPI000966DFCB|nr:DUF4231 domain-containing protein [Streptomyces sp. CB02923]OKI06084.1 hypothetical protein A6A06_38575 [Streptomyces sp. CB02923]
MQRIWDRQSVWSQAADQAKRAIKRARTVALVLGVTGACAGTAAAQVMAWSDEAGKALAFLAAVTVGLVPLATKRAGPQQVRDWTRLRSLSEELKSEIYTYLAHVAPYRDANPQVLLDRTERVITDTSDLVTRTLPFTPRPRALPAVTDVGSYLELRVASQIEGYYRPRAAQMSRRSAQVRRAELVLAATAVVLGGASGAYGSDWATAWVATVTTVVAAVTAHAAASRYAYQEVEFSRTATELESLAARRIEEADAATDDAFVEQCERVISAQNEGWMAKWLSE